MNLRTKQVKVLTFFCFLKNQNSIFREEEKANEKLILSRMLSRNKEKEEELDLAQQSESRHFRASEVPKHVYEPVFQNMVQQFPNRFL